MSGDKKDWTTIAAEAVADFLEVRLQPLRLFMKWEERQEIESLVAGIIRNTHETEGREDCTRRVVEREGAADVGVQDQPRDRLLARVAGNVASGLVSRPTAVRPDLIAGAAIGIAEAILEKIEERRKS